jgi:hypothetical protein
MKNVTITLDDAVATRARVAAASRGKSLSKFVRELIEREIGRNAMSNLETIERFITGPGYPGISRNWRGREELYAERENELLHRHQRFGLLDRPDRAGQKGARGQPAQARNQGRGARSKPTKPE